MKVLLTGGCGFVGTNFIPSLIEAGHEIDVIDNLSHGTYIPKIHELTNFFKYDIRGSNLQSLFKTINPDVVFHFAGLVSIYDCNDNPKSAISNNIAGSAAVFDAALAAGCPRVIFSETSAVYENCQLHPVGYYESQSDPTTIYATTKAAVSLLAESYARTKGLKYTALRYFNIAGPIQDYKRTVPPLFAAVALRLLGGNNPIIFGDGERLRDFIHVDDVNRFHLQALTDNKTIGQTYNLGTGISTSLFDICKIIHKYLDIDHPLEYDFYPEINGEAFEIYANIDKVKTETGWTPCLSIEDCIIDTVDYLKEEIANGNVNPKTFMSDLDISKLKI